MLKKSKNGLFPKKLNIANAPKLRSIEDFWGILSAKVYEKDWSANNLTQLKKKISKCMLEMEWNLYKKLLEVPKPDWKPAEDMAMMHYNFI